MANDKNQDRKKKIDLEDIRSRFSAGQAKQAWRSLDELAETEEFVEFMQQEFPRQSASIHALTRRDFLKLLGASLALAGLSACVPQPVGKILPYKDAPEQLVPGEPLFFATAMEMDGFAQGLVVKSTMGRPIKIEGNPQHPLNLGATDTFAQASLLNLFDPDRAQVITGDGRIRTWDDFLTTISQSLSDQDGKGGSGLRLLTGSITSPTLADQIQALLKKYPQAKWYTYDAVGRDNVQSGSQKAFGQTVQTHYRLDKAEVILSLDNDFTFREPAGLRYSREFISRRHLTGGQNSMNRLYVVESTFSNTGALSDHRLPLQAAQVESFAWMLASRLGIQLPAGSSAPQLSLPAGWLDALVSDLQSHRGSSIVLVGPQQPANLHALGHAINQELGNLGQTIFFTDPATVQPAGQPASLKELVKDLDSGLVDILVVFDGNPAFVSPADINFTAHYQKARLRVYLGMFADETALLSNWHIPAAHYLEMWGDTRAFDGTASIIQPLIEPLYGGKSPYEVISVLQGQSGGKGYDIVRQYWQKQSGLEATGALTATPATPPVTAGATAIPVPSVSPTSVSTPLTPTVSTVPAGATAPVAATIAGAPAGGAAPTAGANLAFDKFWERALHDGFIPNTTLPEKSLTPAANLASQLAAPSAPTGSTTLEIVFEPDPTIWDGRFANNTWLQELPKPISKLTWDNAALVSPILAQRLGVADEDQVELRYKGRSVLAPVLVLPGQPEAAVTVYLGYGRRAGGQVAPDIGFNAYSLRTSDAPWFGYGLEIRKAGGSYSLATARKHFSLEGRDLLHDTTLEQLSQNTKPGQNRENSTPPADLYPEIPYNGHKWGMSINLNSCIGCNACVLACQAENNIPVVGKDQVERGREMHWLRIDTYFQGNIDNPQTAFEPVPCMHCEHAPCEPVCPTGATVHSSEGLNDMVYNRCVGTRYCSNNCPYKVRRFNFYQYVDKDILPLRLMQNPDVTVRDRGVMEKCTYCVQRINRVRIQAEVEGRSIQDGEIKTACQQACPTNAIIFGDINQQNSQVSKLKAEPRNFALLEELNTRPRTTYLAKVRNPNPAIKE